MGSPKNGQEDMEWKVDLCSYHVSTWFKYISKLILT